MDEILHHLRNHAIPMFVGIHRESDHSRASERWCLRKWISHPSTARCQSTHGFPGTPQPFSVYFSRGSPKPTKKKQRYKLAPIAGGPNVSVHPRLLARLPAPAPPPRGGRRSRRRSGRAAPDSAARGAGWAARGRHSSPRAERLAGLVGCGEEKGAEKSHKEHISPPPKKEKK